MKILNNKQIKEIYKQIKLQWGAKLNLDYAFIKSSKNKIFLITKDFGKIDDTKLRINNLGLYFGEIKNEGLRLSIEGSQIVGDKATKNVIELSKDQTKQWFRGEDITLGIDGNYFALVKHKKDFLGCGKLVNKKLLNYVPKARRVSII